MNENQEKMVDISSRFFSHFQNKMGNFQVGTYLMIRMVHLDICYILFFLWTQNQQGGEGVNVKIGYGYDVNILQFLGYSHLAMDKKHLSAYFFLTLPSHFPPTAIFVNFI